MNRTKNQNTDKMIRQLTLHCDTEAQIYPIVEYLSRKIHLNRADLSLLDFVPPFHKMLTNV